MSERLTAIAAMVSNGNTVADIGTDHAYLPIELVKSGKCPSAIAMDINAGPLDIAHGHIADAGLNSKIQTRLSDGLDKLNPGEADTVVISGMGGRLMIKILERWEKPDLIKEWIFQPQSEVASFRIYLAKRGLIIKDERMILEDNKYYIIIKAIADKRYETNELAAAFGPVLLARKDNVLRGYLEQEIASTMDILNTLYERESPKAELRKNQLNQKLLLISNAIDLIGGEET